MLSAMAAYECISFVLELFVVEAICSYEERATKLRLNWGAQM